MMQEREEASEMLKEVEKLDYETMFSRKAGREEEEQEASDEQILKRL
jgi:hypothetical protein